MSKIVHYIGLDVHKESIAVSIAPQNSTGRFWTAVAGRTRHRFGVGAPNCGHVTPPESAVAAAALPAQSKDATGLGERYRTLRHRFWTAVASRTRHRSLIGCTAGFYTGVWFVVAGVRQESWTKNCKESGVWYWLAGHGSEIENEIAHDLVVVETICPGRPGGSG